MARAALHRATLARIQQRLADPGATASFERALGEAASVGDGRLAATARLNLARLLRGVGDHEAAIALLEENERWYTSAGGGEFALLNRCVLCAERDDSEGLARVLEEARAAENNEVQVFALDALARLVAERGDVESARDTVAQADQLAPTLVHSVDESDRVDAALARRLIPTL